MASGRWTVERAADWVERRPWLVGTNFIASTAVNPIEMWRAETFDPDTIDRELRWAAGIGMNVIRVFLHHLAWEEDPDGLLERMGRLLDIADGHGILVSFVLFDSFGGADPRPGPQDPPIPGVFCSRWVAGPGRERLEDESR